MTGIETRIARLERENRLLKGAAVIVGIALLCVLMMGDAAAPAELSVVTAREFHLVRADGSEAGSWKVQPANGLACIDMRSPTSHTMGATFGFIGNREEPCLWLIGKGTPGGSVQLGVQEDGESFMALHDKTGHMDRAKVFVTPEGEGKIVLHSDAQTISWHAP